MTIRRSGLNAMPPKDRAKYGAALAKGAAFDAVYALLRRRHSEGCSQVQIADVIGADPGWLSKQFVGPRNWTMDTFGALVQALDGELEIKVHAMQDPLPDRSNYHAYVEYGDDQLSRPPREAELIQIDSRSKKRRPNLITLTDDEPPTEKRKNELNEEELETA